MAFVTLQLLEPARGRRTPETPNVFFFVFCLCGGNLVREGGGGNEGWLRLAEPVCHSKDGDLMVPSQPASRVAAVTAPCRRNGRLPAR